MAKTSFEKKIRFICVCVCDNNQTENNKYKLCKIMWNLLILSEIFVVNREYNINLSTKVVMPKIKKQYHFIQ